AFSPIAFAGVQETQQSREPGGQLRLPRQQAQSSAALDGTLRSASPAGSQLPVPGAILQLQDLSSHSSTEYFANGEGVFRIFPIAPGDYALRVQAEGYDTLALEKITLRANEVLTLEILMLPRPSE